MFRNNSIQVSDLQNLNDKVWLQPGEKRRVTLHLSARDFEYFSEKRDKWVLERGTFVVRVGASSQDIRLEKDFKL